MNLKSRICLYVIALAFILLEFVKLWAERFSGSSSGIPVYFILPLAPVVLALIISLIKAERED